MTDVVERFFQEEDLIRDFTEELVERFDARCSEKFRAIEDGARAAEARLRAQPADGAAAEQIGKLLVG